MADLDPELLERVAQWCAEAGRQVAIAGIRRALAPLSWDELLALRALLADPPPTRPLGPYALADLARGSPADVAAERERGGRYPSTLDDEDLSRLLDHHGLAHAFARRERDELLHALRAAGGVRTQAAQRLGVDAPALEAALARLGATADAERIRDERRAELRARATISERVHLLLVDAARLEDLGMLAEVEDDLRRRLPEHVRALPGGAPLALALSRSLTLTPPDAQGIVERFGLARPALGAPAQAAANARGRPPGLARPRAPQHARGKALGGRRGPGGARGSTPPRAPGAARGPGGPRGAGASGRP